MIIFRKNKKEWKNTQKNLKLKRMMSYKKTIRKYPSKHQEYWYERFFVTNWIMRKDFERNPNRYSISTIFVKKICELLNFVAFPSDTKSVFYMLHQNVSKISQISSEIWKTANEWNENCFRKKTMAQELLYIFRKFYTTPQEFWMAFYRDLFI